MALTSQRWLCRCLAPGDAGTDAARNRLEAGRVSWPQVLRQANRGLVVTNLAAALDRRGLMPLAPAEVRDYLTTLHALNAERNQLLRRELARAAQACNAIGVEPLLLKGALALLPDSCPGAEARLMADLDLLIQAAAVDACQQALQDRLGYQPAPDWGYGEHRHAVPLRHPEHGGKFELHRAVLDKTREALLPAEEIWRDSQRVVLAGAAVRIPSATHRALHNALHTLLLDRCAESAILELRQLLDLVQLRAREDGGIDWPLIQARFAAQGRSAALGAYLRVARDLFGQPLPAGCPSSLAAAWLGWQLEVGARHPAVIRGRYWGRRLKRLPIRLCTPGWYAMKIRALGKVWSSGFSRSPDPRKPGTPS